MELGAVISVFFFTGVTSGIICGFIASARGVHAGGWFVLGLLFNFLAILFVSIALPSQYGLDQKGLEENTHKRCAYCAEVVRAEAVKCRYCASLLEAKEPIEEDNNKQV